MPIIVIIIIIISLRHLPLQKQTYFIAVDLSRFVYKCTPPPPNL